jgi:hypothetical protein
MIIMAARRGGLIHGSEKPRIDRQVAIGWAPRIEQRKRCTFGNRLRNRRSGA